MTVRLPSAAVQEDVALSGGAVSAPESNPLEDLKIELLESAAASGRGQFALEGASRATFDSILADLEALNPTPAPATSPLLKGTWRLVYASEDVTRSSPFFWAFRKALEGIRDPLRTFGSDQLAESLFGLTDRLPFKSIGESRQRIEGSPMPNQRFRPERLTNQVRVGVFGLGESKMTTECSVAPQEGPEARDDVLNVTIEKTKVLDSTISRLLPFLDGDSAYESKSSLENIKQGSSVVEKRISFLDEDLRIVRNDRDGHVFAYWRVYES
ncbi:unnamed protein product [Vitrella brassicaformis CCMP3155]|uniref:Plastid lipid-associated protein/fibrillin conserved domain-containing protein n=1 Tax=Vitrella brassicaformis (strain CCMP3155) TaxID=1169540 RepID=A0A0G4FU97_VITBC|nr:unnamed protein product [Vitrella brassicaformis CCMP3155]|eukprot:CEM18277.1 unnamed protein product [Vitrella brassicaformis CCMP3155]